MALDPINHENLIQTVKELRHLVGILLAQSGLDQNGIIRAFELAESETKRIDGEMLDYAFKKFHATPEGQEALRIAKEEHRRREHEAWRRWCISEGRIVPHPGGRSQNPGTD